MCDLNKLTSQDRYFAIANAQKVLSKSVFLQRMANLIRGYQRKVVIVLVFVFKVRSTSKSS